VKVAAQIDCSANELRRLMGLPDLLPLHELGSRALELWFVQRVQALSAATADPHATGGRPGSVADRPEAGSQVSPRPRV
jgi:hypothetical protein